MSDYRYQIVEHNGVQCLHVMTEVHDYGVVLPNVEDGIAHAYIPIGDLELSILAQDAMQHQHDYHVHCSDLVIVRGCRTCGEVSYLVRYGPGGGFSHTWVRME